MTAERPALDKAPLGTTLIVAALAMIGPFTIDMIFPGFDQMARDFNASTAAMQQVTSLYLASFAIMCLLHGPLSDALGRKPVMIGGMLFYAAASVFCALAPSLPMLLVGRVLQGAASGVGQIISRAVIRDLFQGGAAQRMMAQVSMIFGVAPAIAPIIGGWFMWLGDWRVLFWILTGYGVGLATIVAVALPETHPLERRTQLRIAPVFDGLSMVVKDISFLRLAFAAAVGFGAQFLYIATAPIIVVGLLNKGELDFWIVFVPLIGGMVLGSWVNSRLAGTVAPRRVATIGISTALLAGIANIAIAAIPGIGLPWVMVAPPLLAFGVALAFPVLQVAMLDRFPRNRGSAASMQSFIQVMLNATVTGTLTPLVSHSMLEIALTATTFSVVASLIWLWHLRTTRQPVTPG